MHLSAVAGPAIVCALLSSCELQAPLRVESWDLSPGGPGFVEALFEIDRPVFREPLSMYKSEVGAVWVMPSDAERPLIFYAMGHPDAQADVELLTDRRFRLVVPRVPADLPPPPYVLWFGVRRGEGVSPGWPTIEGRVQFGTPLVE
jgi:hypothetical protein